MATDCYQKFKSVFAQAKADGLTDTIATAAAQSAMDACLAQQNSRSATVAQPQIAITAGRSIDTGPTVAPKSSS